MSITVYTTNTCAYCKQVKKWLDGKGHNYKEINLDTHPEHQAEAQRVSGVLSVPVTVVEKEGLQSVIIGFNLAKLSNAL